MKKFLVLLLLASPAFGATWGSGCAGLLDVSPGEAAQHAVHGYPTKSVSLGEYDHWFGGCTDSPDIVGGEFRCIHALATRGQLGVGFGPVAISTWDTFGMSHGSMTLAPGEVLRVEARPVSLLPCVRPNGTVGVMVWPASDPFRVAMHPMPIPVFLEPDPDGVPNVLTWRDVLKVRRLRVGLVPVDVVDRKPRWTWAEEGRRDELVYVAGSPSDRDMRVAARMAGWLEDAPYPGPGAWRFAADPAKRGHGVVGLVSDDRQPKFFFHSTTITQET